MHSGVPRLDRGSPAVRVATAAVLALAVSLLVYTAYAASSGPSRVSKECRGAKGTQSSEQGGRHDGRESGTSPKGVPGGQDGPAASRADFDGDGHTDLAFSGPHGDLHGKRLAGHVAVTYGSGSEDRSVRCQLITQDDDAVPGEVAEEAAFGAEPLARDFDGDGYTDLAVTTREEIDKSGVIVLWGSADGLGGGTVVEGASFGDESEAHLAAGDFDGDGHPDLALNPGSDDGLLKGPFDRKGRPSDTGPLPEPELPDDPTGRLHVSDLVSGDVDGDGATDLVTFHSDDDGESAWSELTWLGNYYRGGKDGFEKADSSRVPDGETAVIGDVDKDGHGDLIVSPRGEDVSRGAVEVAYGTKDGPGSRTETIDADTPGVPGENAEHNDDDVFTSLDAGDVDGDGYADVVAGAPGSGAGDVKFSAGTVLFLRGSSDGLTGEVAELLDESAVGARPERGDRFGEGVRLADLDAERGADLAVGASSEGSIPAGGRFKGAAWTVPGGDEGPETDAASAFGPEDFGLSDEDSPEFGEEYAR